MDQNRMNTLFINWCNQLKEEGTALTTIYKQIGISRSKGDKIRSGGLNATYDDLKALVVAYPALFEQAHREGVEVMDNEINMVELVKELKQQIRTLEKEVRERREENKRMRRLLK